VIVTMQSHCVDMMYACEICACFTFPQYEPGHVMQASSLS
jgi:hypothetical protein